jgi:hypothetical protein
MTGPAEAGTPTNDPADSPLESRLQVVPEKPYVSPSEAGTPTADCDQPVGDDAPTPPMAEIPEHGRLLLRTVIVGLALALLAGAVARAYTGKTQNEPIPTPRRVPPVPVASSATTPCTRPAKGLPGSSRDAPMASTASPSAVQKTLTEPSVSERTRFRYIGRDSRPRSTRLSWNSGSLPRWMTGGPLELNALSGPSPFPRPRTPAGAIT